MKKNVKKWRKTAAILDSNTPFREQFEEKEIGKIIKDGYYIVNQSNFWIFEEEFIEDVNHPLQIILDKLSYKDYSKIECFNSLSKEFLEKDCSDEVEIYKKIIRSNIIEGVALKKLNISLDILSRESYSKNQRVKQLINIYILLLLSNRTNRKQNKLKFTFEEELDNFILDIEFGIQDNLEVLLDIYHWIVSNNEYSEAYKVKLQIVRSVIIKQKQLDDIKSIKAKSESIFNRIVSGKTDEYFRLQNNLKDDFVKISKSISENNSSLNTRLFGWLTAFSLVIFDFIKGSNGTDLIKRIVWSISEKTNIVLFLLCGALVIITIIYNLDILSIRKQYNSLRDFYVNQLLVQEEEFDKLIAVPSYCNLYNMLLIVLIVIMLIRLIVIMLIRSIIG